MQQPPVRSALSLLRERRERRDAGAALPLPPSPSALSASQASPEDGDNDSEASAIWDRCQPPRRLSLGCPGLDAALGGGLLARGITEVSGEASCGKTQLVLRLLASALLADDGAGLWGRALYLCTEGRAPTDRLRSMATAWATRGSRTCECPSGSSSSSSTTASSTPASSTPTSSTPASSAPASSAPAAASGAGVFSDVLDRVVVQEVHELSELWRSLSESLPRLLAAFSRDRSLGPVRVVVVDSLAAVMRSGAEGAQGPKAMSLPERSSFLLHLSQLLRALSDGFGCAFVVVNQVTQGGASLRAALGLTWSNCVNTRIMLSRGRASTAPPREAGEAQSAHGGTRRDRGVRVLAPSHRELEVDFSPAHGNVKVPYTVYESGICRCLASS